MQNGKMKNFSKDLKNFVIINAKIVILVLNT